MRRSSYLLTSFKMAIIPLLSVFLAARPASAFDISTHHYDYGRTGWNPSETTLTQANVGPQFGLVATTPLDDLVDAQPLFRNNQGIVGKPGAYQVIYVAT